MFVLGSCGFSEKLDSEANAVSGRPVDVKRMHYGGSRKHMVMAELVHSRIGCVRTTGSAGHYFGSYGECGVGTVTGAVVEFETRLTACCIR